MLFSRLNLETIINQPEPSGPVEFGASRLMRTWMEPVVFSLFEHRVNVSSVSWSQISAALCGGQAGHRHECVRGLLLRLHPPTCTSDSALLLLLPECWEMTVIPQITSQMCYHPLMVRSSAARLDSSYYMMIRRDSVAQRSGTSSQHALMAA